MGARRKKFPFRWSPFLVVEVEPLEVPGGHVDVRDPWLDPVALHVLHHLGGDLGQNVLWKGDFLE